MGVSDGSPWEEEAIKYYLEAVCSVYEKLFERSDILSDVYMLSGGHSYTLWWTFSIL